MDAPVPADPVPSDVPDVPAPEPPAPCPLVPDALALAICATGAAAVADGSPYDTLADALAGSRGDVTVCPGVHDGGVLIQGRRLVAADPTPDATVLGPGPTDSPIATLSDGELVGLTLLGGRAPSGAAVTGLGTATLTCVTARGNTAWLADGGAVRGDDVVVGWSTFSDNVATGVGGAIDARRVQVWDSTFAGNDAARGGALSIRGAGDLARIVVRENTAGEGGGVVFEPGSPATLALGDVRFDRNVADSGGGLLVCPWSNADVDGWRVAFEDNGATRGGGGVDLTGYHGVRLRLAEATFARNDGGEAGGLGISGWMPGVRVDLALVHFHDNVGAVAGALGASSAAGRVAFHGDRLEVLRNEAPRGAASLGSDDTFDCIDCDFGTGADDNSPTDASRADGTEEALGSAFQL